MGIQFREKKCDCRVYLYRLDQGETLQSTTPMNGVIHLVDVLLGTHPFWLGIIELPLQDENLLRNVSRLLL